MASEAQIMHVLTIIIVKPLYSHYCMNCDSITTILGTLSINLGCHLILIDATLN